MTEYDLKMTHLNEEIWEKDSVIRQEGERRDKRETLDRVLGFINMKNSV